MSEEQFDLAIIGGGSGGMSAARCASARGLKTVLFEPDDVGGTCVNRGCVPKKMLVDASRHADAFDEGPALGWQVAEPSFEWATLRDRVQHHVASLSTHQADSLEEAGVTLVRRRVELAGGGRVVASDGDDGASWRAEHIVLATGSRPLVPDLPGAELALVSDDLFRLERLPKRLALIGGGYISIEFACLLNRFGVEVTVFESGERILEGFDPDTVGHLQSSMAEDGVEFVLNAKVSAIEEDGDARRLRLEGDETRSGFDEVALLIGRSANVENLGLKAAGVALTEAGGVEVDGYYRTSAPGVFAIGDLSATLQLTPVAIESGRSVIDAIVGRPFVPTPDDHVPTAVYATPECGAVGLTEAEAKENGVDYVLRETRFRPLDNALLKRERETLVKLVLERTTGRLLGFHAYGSQVAESTQLVALAIRAGLGENDLYATMALHPTNAEEIMGLGRPERPFDG